MSIIKSKAGFFNHLLITGFIIATMFNCQSCHGDLSSRGTSAKLKSATAIDNTDDSPPLTSLLVLPKNPAPGKSFRILATGGKKILKSKIIVTGPSGNVESTKSKTGQESPYWRIDDFTGNYAGKYKVTLLEDKKEISNLDFTISPSEESIRKGMVWKSLRGMGQQHGRSVFCMDKCFVSGLQRASFMAGICMR